MDFDFTEEQQLTKQAFHEFLLHECPREYVREMDEREEYPAELFKKMGALGYMGLPIPESNGGGGAGALTLGVVMEELGAAFTAAGLIYLRTVSMFGSQLADYGSAELQRQYLGRLSSGDLIVAFALTEPDAGSDLASLATEARADGDDYVITGQKMFCSGGGYSDLIYIATRTDSRVPKHRGISIFLVDGNADGISSRKLKKLGTKASPTYEMFFDNVRVPADRLLGPLDGGWRVLTGSLERERFSLACLCAGGAQAATTDALEYAKQRRQFGRSIGEFQAIQHKLADMQTEVDAARLLAYRVGQLVEEGISCPREAAMAKLFASEVFMRASHNGIQIMGGYGYMMECDMQRYFRDARLMSIGGGTSEIQRNIISKQMGL